MPARPYRVIAAYDTETTNLQRGVKMLAFPILHQIGFLNKCVESLREITPDNVKQLVNVHTFRHAVETYDVFEQLLARDENYVPVVMVHNLGFDMYALAPWLLTHKTNVLARSSAKPIKIEVLNADDQPALIFWDTVGFFAKNLATMGAELGFEKLVGMWDYEKVRTPESPLTSDEYAYAERDIHVLFAYMGHYLRLNTTLDESKLGRKISTKTGVVRYKREMAFDKLWALEQKRTAGGMWRSHTQHQRIKTNDELWTAQQATRGGLTFTAKRWASIPLDLAGTDNVVIGYDAASMHPSHMVSHWYPRDFAEADVDVLALDMELVKAITLNELLEHFEEPFPVAFNACIDIKGLRLKEGSVFKHEGIATLANARRGWPDKERKRKADYKDSWGTGDEAFGKLESADYARLYMTELDWWIINQVYDYDTATPVHGYETGRFCRPTDYAVLSVMRFYKTKKDFKAFMKTGELTPAIETVLPECDLSRDDVKQLYAILKSDLNALYGIEITNEARPDQKLVPRGGIVDEPELGVKDMPSLSKTWYQFGQRVVGWSRIAQVINILLIKDYCEGIICGDTDSLKVLVKRKEVNNVKSMLKTYANALTRAKTLVCDRVKRNYPQHYDEMEGIGGYENEFETTRFYAAWNKAYMLERDGKAEVVIAGIPTDKGETSYEKLANELLEVCTWGEVCGQLLGYNITIGYGVTSLNDKVVPEFGTWFDDDVDGVRVNEPAMIAICPDPRTIGGTLEPENRRNSVIALGNNADICVTPTLIDWDGTNGYTIERF